MENKTILQGFEWDLVADATHWKHLTTIALQLKQLGFSAIWLPPAYKGADGIRDVGYGVYDLYDLGEFDQKGSVPTKYGTKDEYLKAVKTLQDAGLEVYADIVLDHFLGADEEEEVEATRHEFDNRNEQIGGEEKILAWSKFTHPGRGSAYNDYIWTWKNFKGVDWDSRRNEDAIFSFEGKSWDKNVDPENGNFDYLMGADLDMDNPETVEQLEKWGSWYQTLGNFDGYRLDAVKHIQFTFFIEWLKKRDEEKGREMFAVGEYWHGDVNRLETYLDSCGGSMSLFDVPLHFNLQHASSSDGNYDMRNIFENTLLKSRHNWATTFVDNHDTQPGQSLESWVEGWFKVHAYALILLHEEGIPCVFYGDLFGIPTHQIDPVGEKLETLLLARQKLAYGPQMEYLDHPNIIGFTRFGEEVYDESGHALVLTNKDAGVKNMCVGARHAQETFVDCLKNHDARILISEDGFADFPVNGGSVSLWVSEQAMSIIQKG